MKVSPDFIGFASTEIGRVIPYRRKRKRALPISHSERKFRSRWLVTTVSNCRPLDCVASRVGTRRMPGSNPLLPIQPRRMCGALFCRQHATQSRHRGEAEPAGNPDRPPFVMAGKLDHAQNRPNIAFSVPLGRGA